MKEINDEVFIEELTKAVTEFLCTQNLLFRFIECLNKYKHEGIETNTIEAVIKHAYGRGSIRKAVCINFFNWSFTWGLTKEGAEYWGDVDNKFFGFVIKQEFYKKYFD